MVKKINKGGRPEWRAGKASKAQRKWNGLKAHNDEEIELLAPEFFHMEPRPFSRPDVLPECPLLHGYALRASRVAVLSAKYRDKHQTFRELAHRAKFMELDPEDCDRFDRVWAKFKGSK